MTNADDVVEILQVIADYGHMIDHEDWDAAEGILADGFRFDLSAFDAPDLHGVGGLRAHPRRALRVHMTTNTVVTTVDGTVARARSKYLGFDESGAPLVGDYEDELVRTPGGWRIKVRCGIPRSLT